MRLIRYELLDFGPSAIDSDHPVVLVSADVGVSEAASWQTLVSLT